METATRTKNKGIELLLPESKLDWLAENDGSYVVVLRSDRLGDASLPVELGEALLKEFIATIVASPEVPQGLSLYGSAARLAGAHHALAADLGRLSGRGCNILCCRQSFETLIPSEQPAVGRLVDWAELIAVWKEAQKIFWL